eukprot:7212693-Pyramimonas_sp.AAC.1
MSHVLYSRRISRSTCVALAAAGVALMPRTYVTFAPPGAGGSSRVISLPLTPSSAWQRLGGRR